MLPNSELLEIIKRPNVPLPVSLFWLSTSSSLVAFILLPVSLLDLGVLSFYINPPVTIFTILYHGFVLVVSQRPRKPDHPTYYASAILFAFLLDITWIVAFITTTVVYASMQQDEFYSVNNLKSHGLPVSLGTQRFQIFLTLLLAILTGGMAFKGYRIAQEEGEPDSWRPEGLEKYYDDFDDVEKMSANGLVEA